MNKSTINKINQAMTMIQSMQDCLDDIKKEIDMAKRLITTVPTMDDYIQYNMYDDIALMLEDQQYDIPRDQLNRIQEYIQKNRIGIRTMLVDGMIQYTQSAQYYPDYQED